MKSSGQKREKGFLGLKNIQKLRMLNIAKKKLRLNGFMTEH